MDLEVTDSQWSMTVQIENTNGPAYPAHDASLISFDVNGERLHEEPVGDVPPGEYDVPVEASFETNDFPAIQTLVAEESPCGGGLFEIMYWTSPEGGSRDGVWRHVHRECDEQLPPQRVLDDVGPRSP